MVLRQPGIGDLVRYGRRHGEEPSSPHAGDVERSDVILA